MDCIGHSVAKSQTGLSDFQKKKRNIPASEAAKAQKGGVTCPKAHSLPQTKPAVDSGCLAPEFMPTASPLRCLGVTTL